MRMFFVVVLLVWAGMHIYVFWRISSVPSIARHVPRVVLWFAASILWICYIVARNLDHVGLKSTARILEIVGADWVGVLFLLLASLLAVDLVTIFGWLMPGLAPTLRGWALLGGGLLSVVALVQGYRAPTVENYEVRLVGLRAELNGTVLVLASDFHLGTQLGKDWLEARVHQIEAERPAIIVLGGDIIEGDDYSSEIELLPSLRKLHAALGVWAVTGNHEFHTETESGAKVLEVNGIHVLHDRWVEVRPGLILAGVDDLTSRRRHGGVGNSLERALQGRPPGTATILISHVPWEAETAARSGVGLMLSSHTHEGQIWPFSYLVRLAYPLLAGRYEVNGMPLIVCRGTGTWGPRMRLWQRGEIIRITLRSGGH